MYRKDGQRADDVYENTAVITGKFGQENIVFKTKNQNENTEKGRDFKLQDIYGNDANRDTAEKIMEKIMDHNTMRIQSSELTGSDSVKTKISRWTPVCLVLLCFLLLIVVIVLCALISTNNTNYTSERNQLLTNITKERDQLLTNITNITKERNQLLTNITKERDQLLTNITNITKERDQLLTNITNITKERNQLLTNITEERDQLLTNITNITKERDQLLTNITNITKERDQLLTRITNITKEKDQLLTRITNITKERDELLTRITNITKERDELLTRITNITKEKDQLLIQNQNLTAERKQLIFQKDNVTKERDQLKAETNELRKILADGWIYYQSSLYLISSDKKIWTDSRTDCQLRGADLIIINNRHEQDFAKKNFCNENVWIGLTDIDIEGKWKWVDGSALTSGFWDSGQPNGGRSENCVHFWFDIWHDLSCNIALKWICEKTYRNLG